ncbi:FAD-binding domain-containing protein [Piscinibacter sakaiensis]
MAAVRPDAYARTRNALDGAVTRLSPYLTHGLLELPEVLAAVAARHPLGVQHKFVYELGWREYFHHVWAHRGDGILQSLHAGPLPDAAYAAEVPTDVREARSGVPVIDQAVRGLYAEGWLHNHARMWLASYLVHLRKVHWRAGADWLWGHLLDGDLASNHLSWQWVAGTGSHQPYLFNAGNVARHAPPHWHSPGSVLDTSYEALDALARDPLAVPATPAGEGVDEPGRDAAAAMTPSGAPPQLVWFKRDLRVHDHAPLAQAAGHGPVLALYVYEPSVLRAPQSDACHLGYVNDCLAALRAALARRGCPLLVLEGECPEVLEGLRRVHGFRTLWSHEETGLEVTWARDRRVAAWCRAQGVAWHELPQNGVVRRLAPRRSWTPSCTSAAWTTAARWPRRWTARRPARG